MKRFEIIKSVKNHPEELCCTECWQRGINWGEAGTREEILMLLDSHYDYQYLERSKPYSKPMFQEDMGYLNGIEAAIALINGELND